MDKRAAHLAVWGLVFAAYLFSNVLHQAKEDASQAGFTRIARALEAGETGQAAQLAVLHRDTDGELDGFMNGVSVVLFALLIAACWLGRPRPISSAAPARPAPAGPAGPAGAATPSVPRPARR